MLSNVFNNSLTAPEPGPVLGPVLWLIDRMHAHDD